MPKSGSKLRLSRRPWQKSGEAIASKADGAGRGQKPKRQYTFACQLFAVSESCYRYRPQLNEENAVIADWLLRITDSQRNWGFGLCFLSLRNV